MVNFYRRLGISPTSSRQQLIDALPRVGEELQKCINGILLNDKRREAYDHAHDAMTRIAEIRGLLNIPITESWSTTDEAEWSQPLFQTRNRLRRYFESRRRLVTWIIIAIVVLSIASVLHVKHGNQPGPLQPKPLHGTMFVDRGYSVSSLIVENQDDYDCYVKIVHANTQELVRSCFLERGRDIEIGMPYGMYEIYVSFGDDWYGPNFGFASNGSTCKLDKKFEFWNGMYRTIVLRSVTNGNLSKTEIGNNEFDELH